MVNDVRDDPFRRNFVRKVERGSINEGEGHGLGRAGVRRVENDIYGNMSDVGCVTVRALNELCEGGELFLGDSRSDIAGV